MVYKLVFQEAKEALFSGKLSSVLVLSLIFNILVAGNQKVGRVTCSVQENKGELLLPLLSFFFLKRLPTVPSTDMEGRKVVNESKMSVSFGRINSSVKETRLHQYFCFFDEGRNV